PANAAALVSASAASTAARGPSPTSAQALSPRARMRRRTRRDMEVGVGGEAPRTLVITNKFRSLALRSALGHLPGHLADAVRVGVLGVVADVGVHEPSHLGARVVRERH